MKLNPGVLTIRNAKSNQVPIEELQFEATRSRGPGGQNVNRTSTAVQLRWRVFDTQAFHGERKAVLLQKLGPLLNRDGELCIRSEEFRSQQANKRRCLEKLESLLKKAFFVPKVRKKTRPTRSSVEKRHQHKKQRSETKQWRKKVSHD